jgi:hypothetical protein
MGREMEEIFHDVTFRGTFRGIETIGIAMENPPIFNR